MIPKGRLYSILHHKCPRCNEGSLYYTGPYQKGFTKMYETCTVCGLHYAQEPSFYSGAMYVSYALQVALFTTVYVSLRVLFNPAAEVYMAIIIGAAVVLFPVTFRLSRAIYLNFFYSYDADAKKQSLNGTPSQPG